MDLAGRVKQYAYDLVAVHVKHEFERQVDVVWKKHINSLVAYAKTAFKEHQRALKAIKEQQEMEERAKAELLMLAFSVLAGPAVAWIGGTIEHKLVPRYLGKFKQTELFSLQRKFDPKVRSAKPKTEKVPIYTPQGHSHVTAKVLGDFTGSLAQTFLVNPMLKVDAPDSSRLDQQLNQLPESISIEIFELNINNLLLEAKDYCGTAIVNYAGTIKKDSRFGEKWVEKLARERPSLRYDIEKQEAIESMLRAVVDEQRQQWAKNPNWLYFGHDPKPLSPSLTTKALEAELWALWILSEGYEWREKPQQDQFVKTKKYYRVYNGKSGIDLDRVLGRLVDLGVVGSRNDAERNRRQALLEAADRQESSKVPPGSVQKVDWRDRPKPPPDPATWAAEQNKQIDRLPMEVVGVEGDVDTEEEFKEVLDWAVKQTVQKPQVFRMNLTTSTVPRYIKPIDPANT